MGMVRSFWGNVSYSHAFSPTRGAPYFILVIWDPYRFSRPHVFIYDYFVAVEVVLLTSGLDITYVLVYAL